MKNERQNVREERTAKKEPPIAADELLAEIKPLLDDYFLGEIQWDGRQITYRLPNGQVFSLTAKELSA